MHAILLKLLFSDIEFYGFIEKTISYQIND